MYIMLPYVTVSTKMSPTMRRWDWNATTNVSLSLQWLSLCKPVTSDYSLRCFFVFHLRWFLFSLLYIVEF